MHQKEFKQIRNRLTKTQAQLAALLGVSVKTIQSYEQGWRAVPAHVERHLYFLLSKIKGDEKSRKPCWVIKKCPPKQKKQCPVWEFKSGKSCWHINCSVCEGSSPKNWEEKIKTCRKCEVLISLMG